MSNTVKLNNCPKCGAPIPAAAPQGLCPKCVLAGAAQATESGAGATATGEIPSLERVAAAFPQLEILELIGRGGMGFVFKARQPHLERFVALKLLPDKLAKDPHFAERFNREGRVLARLNHPGIVSVYDFGQTGGFYFLLMEYVDGVNLRQAMHAGRFSPGEALAIVPKICEALQYAHEQGILHRDIKPENILLDAKGRVKIADFGIAKLVGEAPQEMTLTGTGAALGTPHYIAPEQLEKPSTVDHRADIYSLGVVFYEMLTGELPIGRFAAPSSKTPVSSGVDEVVFRTLEKDRERRFQTAGDVKTTVEHLTRSGAGGPPVGQPGAETELHRAAIEEARTAVRRPAKGLLVAGVFNWVGSIAIVCGLAYLGLGQNAAIGPAQLGIICLLMVACSSLVMLGGWKMMRLESYGLAMLGSVLAMVTSPGSIIGLPLGLWAFLTLRQLRVRDAFVFQRGQSARNGEHGISRWSIYGALLVGLSLPAPVMTFLAILTGRGGIGPGELWITLGSVAMPGLGGTLLGWLGLNEIRESHGRVRGLPLAMFATLLWPLTLFGGLTVGLPMFFLVPTGEPTLSHTIGRFLVLLLPAAVIAFSFWAIYATARWASQQPIAQRRGVLKWVFIGVIVVGMGVVMVTNPGKDGESMARPQPEIGWTKFAEETNAVVAPIQANFRIPKGQAVTFEVLQRDVDPPVPVRFFAGYIVAADDERGRCSILLKPERSGSGSNSGVWRIEAVTDDGARASGMTAELGELLSNLPTNHLHVIEPDSSFEILLTRPYPGAETNGLVPRPTLSLGIVSKARGKVGPAIESLVIGLGSTNWAQSLRQQKAAKPSPRPNPGEVLASQWLKSPVGTNTTNWIRFTFANVEIREEDGKQWLGIDYATDIRGDCEEVFRVDGNGFKAVTRKTGLLVTPPDSPAILRQRVEWMVPPGVKPETLREFRDAVDDALVAKSFVIPEGEQRPLLRFPIGTVGDLSVGVGAKHRLPAPEDRSKP